VIFTFKKAATAYFGNFTGGGLLHGLRIADADVFIMPGPMEATASAAQKMVTLREYLAR